MCSDLRRASKSVGEHEIGIPSPWGTTTNTDEVGRARSDGEACLSASVCLSVCPVYGQTGLLSLTASLIRIRVTQCHDKASVFTFRREREIELIAMEMMMMMRRRERWSRWIRRCGQAERGRRYTAAARARVTISSGREAARNDEGTQFSISCVCVCTTNIIIFAFSARTFNLIDLAFSLALCLP